MCLLLIVCSLEFKSYEGRQPSYLLLDLTQVLRSTSDSLGKIWWRSDQVYAINDLQRRSQT